LHHKTFSFADTLGAALTQKSLKRPKIEDSLIELGWHGGLSFSWAQIRQRTEILNNFLSIVYTSSHHIL
jgi:hypothetical protein